MSRSDPIYALAGKAVCVLGHRGMLGSALVRRLAREGCEVVTPPPGLDLRRQEATLAFFAETRPQAVFLAAATVGGIAGNQMYPASFLYDNLMITANVLEAARLFLTEKLLFVGSTSAYPPSAPQPIREESLMSGPPDEAHQWNALAKISGVQMVRAFRAQYGCDFVAAMPCNLFGPGDAVSSHTGHVIPALIDRAHKAKLAGEPELVVWGSGSPRREFLYVDECADALSHLMKHYSGDLQINVGPGEDISIRELAEEIARVVEFEGDLVFDASKPDGPQRRQTDISRLSALGWSSRMDLSAALRETYEWMRNLEPAQA